MVRVTRSFGSFICWCCALGGFLILLAPQFACLCSRISMAPTALTTQVSVVWILVWSSVRTWHSLWWLLLAHGTLSCQPCGTEQHWAAATYKAPSHPVPRTKGLGALWALVQRIFPGSTWISNEACWPFLGDKIGPYQSILGSWEA